MIVEEVIPHKIKDLLFACLEQHDTIYRLIVETEPGFQTSKLRILLNSRKWAQAVSPHLIVSKNHEDLLARGNSILDQLIGKDLRDKKFLDFGCGDGYVALAAARRGAVVVAYDREIVKSPVEIVDDWEAVRNAGPYDIVLIYDVLDHSKEEPVECLKKVRSVLGEDGLIFLRCHPWCCRTGGHHYTNLNKAFVHLFFHQDLLNELGAPGIWTRKIIHPSTAYDDWIMKSGLTKVSEDVKREELEPFWGQEPLLRSIIQEKWKDSYEESLALGEKFPSHQMSQSFNDFILKKENK